MKATVFRSDIGGEFTAPPSKSYALRYLIAAFLSGEKVTVCDVGSSKDVFYALKALSALGAQYDLRGGDVAFSGRKDVDNAVIDCGESATLYRILLCVTAALGVKARFITSDTLAARPHDSLIKLLNEHGAKTDGVFLSGKLTGGIYEVDCKLTSQYLSGLLFALPLIGGVRVDTPDKPVSAPYVAMTLAVLKDMGVEWERRDNRFVLNAAKAFKPRSDKLIIEGDWSAAAFAFAACSSGNVVRAKGLDGESLQGDRRLKEIFSKFGFEVSVDENFVEAKAPERLTATTVDCEHIPDLVPALAALSARACGVTTLKNVARLRYKESDRISAISAVLEKFSVSCGFDGSDLIITGNGGKEINTPSRVYIDCADHRIAMLAAALASAYSVGGATLVNAECVNKSYSSFFDDLIRLNGRVSYVDI